MAEVTGTGVEGLPGDVHVSSSSDVDDDEKYLRCLEKKNMNLYLYQGPARSLRLNSEI